MGSQQHLALVDQKMGEVRDYAQAQLGRMQGAIDLASKERDEDRKYFRQLVEDLRTQLGVAKAENIALKEGLADQTRRCEVHCESCLALMAAPPASVAPPTVPVPIHRLLVVCWPHCMKKRGLESSLFRGPPLGRLDLFCLCLGHPGLAPLERLSRGRLKPPLLGCMGLALPPLVQVASRHRHHHYWRHRYQFWEWQRIGGKHRQVCPLRWLPRGWGSLCRWRRPKMLWLMPESTCCKLGWRICEKC